MTLSLTDFLLARIAEHEADAHAEIAAGYNGHADPGWTSDQVLARCAVDRQIIAEHRPTATQRTSEGYECRTCLSPAYRYDWPNLWTTQPWPCTTLRLLASLDADHSDYDENWKP